MIFESSEFKRKMCGRSTVILENEKNEKFYKLYRCKELDCPVCSSVIKANFTERLVYYVDLHDMTHFFTMTTTLLDYNDLSNKFSKMMRVAKKLNKEHYIVDYLSRKKSKTVVDAEVAYNNLIDDMVDYEAHYSLLNDEVHEKYNADYFTSLSIKLSRLINSGGLMKYIDEELKKDLSYYKFNQLKDRYLKGIEKFKDKKYIYLSAKEKFNYRKTFLEFFFNEIEYIFDVNSIKQKIKDKILKNTEDELYYLRVLEYQKNGSPHFHILTNYYLNYYVQDKVKDKNSFIYDDKDFSLDEDFTKNDASENISRYVSKYVSKESIENAKEVYEEDEDERSNRVVTSSNNMSISLSYKMSDLNSKDDKTEKFEMIAFKKEKTPTSTWGRINGSLDSFYNSLLDVSDDSRNSLINSIHESYKNINKKIKIFKDENKKDENFKDLIKEYKQSLYDEFATYKIKKSTQLIYEELKAKSVADKFTLEIKDVDKYKSIKDEEQRSFIDAVCSNNNIIVLNGKAGTGKTTSLKNVLDVVDFSDVSVEFVSFTGKAVSRINEVIEDYDYNAKTIHRLSNAQFSSVTDFLKNENNLLEADVVFIDEFSMVDKLTFASFLNALKDSCKVVLVGDSNQLNPVASNDLFFEIDLIANDFANIEKITLLNNYRSKDKVNALAMNVLNKEVEKINFKDYDIDEVEKYYSEGFQIITSSNRLTKNINNRLSANKKDITLTAKNNYNINDDVLILRNDKINEVYNGDKATIVSNDGMMITLEKNGRQFDYSVFKSAQSFQHYSSFTIHKSQGSEFDKVLVVLDSTSLLCNSNILYTAITRAKSVVEVMVVDNKVINLFNQKQKNEDVYNLLDARNDYSDDFVDITIPESLEIN